MNQKLTYISESRISGLGGRALIKGEALIAVVLFSPVEQVVFLGPSPWVRVTYVCLVFGGEKGCLEVFSVPVLEIERS